MQLLPSGFLSNPPTKPQRDGFVLLPEDATRWYGVLNGTSTPSGGTTVADVLSVAQTAASGFPLGSLANGVLQAVQLAIASTTTPNQAQAAQTEWAAAAAKATTNTLINALVTQKVIDLHQSANKAVQELGTKWWNYNHDTSDQTEFLLRYINVNDGKGTLLTVDGDANSYFDEDWDRLMQNSSEKSVQPRFRDTAASHWVNSVTVALALAKAGLLASIAPNCHKVDLSQNEIKECMEQYNVAHDSDLNEMITFEVTQENRITQSYLQFLVRALGTPSIGYIDRAKLLSGEIKAAMKRRAAQITDLQTVSTRPYPGCDGFNAYYVIDDGLTKDTDGKSTLVIKGGLTADRYCTDPGIFDFKENNTQIVTMYVFPVKQGAVPGGNNPEWARVNALAEGRAWAAHVAGDYANIWSWQLVSNDGTSGDLDSLVLKWTALLRTYCGYLGKGDDVAACVNTTRQ